MKEFAVIEKGIVVNIAVAESIQIMGVVLPDAELVVEITDATGIAYIGAEYRATKKKFVPIKPAASWSFDEKAFEWVAPKPYPSDNKNYYWDEESLSWVEIVVTDLDAVEPISE